MCCGRKTDKIMLENDKEKEKKKQEKKFLCFHISVFFSLSEKIEGERKKNRARKEYS